jgi:predicted phage tail component-like protein
MRYFIFAGKDSRDYFQFTLSIEREYLPPIKVPTFKVPNRAGLVGLKRNEVSERTLKVTVSSYAADNEELRARMRQLAEFLIYEEDQDLIFSDEPHLKYRARFSNTRTDLEEIAATGEGELIFIAFDPFAYELAEKSQLTRNRYPNLIPKTTFENLDSGTDWTDWYETLNVSSEESDAILRASMTGFTGDTATENPRMRLLMGHGNRTYLEAGKPYTFSFKILPSIALDKLEYLNYFQYPADGSATIWGDILKDGILLDNLQKEADSDYLVFQQTFVPPVSGEARMGFGFGIWSNPNMSNGTWFRVKEFKLEAGSEATPFYNDPTVFVNDGTAPTFPRIRAVPTADTPYIKITNVTTNKIILYNEPVTAWNILIIDTDTNKAYIEQTGETKNKHIALESEFFALEKGENLIRVEGEGLTGNVRLYWRERYW